MLEAVQFQSLMKSLLGRKDGERSMKRKWAQTGKELRGTEEESREREREREKEEEEEERESEEKRKEKKRKEGRQKEQKEEGIREKSSGQDNKDKFSVQHTQTAPRQLG